VGGFCVGITVGAAANASERTATANSVKAPAGVIVTATADSVKAPTRSTREPRCAPRRSRCSRQSRSHSRRCAPRSPRSCGACVVCLRRTRRPFHSHPHRLFDQPMRAGMKGAGRSGKPDDASTAATGGSEARSEARDRSDRGLSRCSRYSNGSLSDFHAVCGRNRSRRRAVGVSFRSLRSSDTDSDLNSASSRRRWGGRHRSRNSRAGSRGKPPRRRVPAGRRSAPAGRPRPCLRGRPRSCRRRRARRRPR